MFSILRKDEIDRLVGSKVGLQLSGNFYYKGILKEIRDNSVVLEFLNGKDIIILLDKVEFVKVLE